MKVFHNFDETFYKTNIKFWYLKKKLQPNIY